jgi:3-oxoacyl-[acyl-carrier protein] reductase
MTEQLGNIVVAGGSKGIGLALVDRLRRRASKIIVLSRQVDDLQVDDIVQHVAVDFTEKPFQVSDLPEVIQAAIYCPGSITLRSFRSLKEEDFCNDWEINFLGAVRFLQSCWPGLSANTAEMPGSVLLMSTVAVGQGMPMHASIASAKGAVEGLMRSLAAEWAPKVRVNCLAPALTETPLSARFFSSDAARQAVTSRYPMNRAGKPDDLAAIAEFLLSPETGWITGQTIGVDGGMSTIRK